MSRKTIELEVCANREYLNQYLDYDAEGLRDQDVDAFIEVLIYNLRDYDFDVYVATGGRSTYHGWNNAQFKHRFGVVGSFCDLSPLDYSVIHEVIAFAKDTMNDQVWSRMKREGTVAQ